MELLHDKTILQHTESLRLRKLDLLFLATVPIPFLQHQLSLSSYNKETVQFYEIIKLDNLCDLR